MARISTYELDAELAIDDKIIGTDTSNNAATMNFSLEQLGDFFGRTGIAEAGTTFTFNVGPTYVSGDGTGVPAEILPGYIYFNSQFSASLSEIVVSTETNVGINTRVFFVALSDEIIILNEAGERRGLTYGFFDIDAHSDLPEVRVDGVVVAYRVGINIHSSGSSTTGLPTTFAVITPAGIAASDIDITNRLQRDLSNFNNTIVLEDTGRLAFIEALMLPDDEVLSQSGIEAAITDNDAFTTAIGLGNVDNTSDADKPISIATQAALDGLPVIDLAPYALLDSPALIGTPTAPTASDADDSTQIATTSWVRGHLTAPGGGEANVQSDFDETDTTSDAFILNKPTTITADQATAIADNTTSRHDAVTIATATGMGNAIVSLSLTDQVITPVLGQIDTGTGGGDDPDARHLTARDAVTSISIPFSTPVTTTVTNGEFTLTGFDSSFDTSVIPRGARYINFDDFSYEGRVQAVTSTSIIVVPEASQFRITGSFVADSANPVVLTTVNTTSVDGFLDTDDLIVGGETFLNTARVDGAIELGGNVFIDTITTTSTATTTALVRNSTSGLIEQAPIDFPDQSLTVSEGPDSFANVRTIQFLGDGISLLQNSAGNITVRIDQGGGVIPSPGDLSRISLVVIPNTFSGPGRDILLNFTITAVAEDGATITSAIISDDGTTIATGDLDALSTALPATVRFENNETKTFTLTVTGLNTHGNPYTRTATDTATLSTLFPTFDFTVAPVVSGTSPIIPVNGGTFELGDPIQWAATATSDRRAFVLGASTYTINGVNSDINLPYNTPVAIQGDTVFRATQTFTSLGNPDIVESGEFTLNPIKSVRIGSVPGDTIGTSITLANILDLNFWLEETLDIKGRLIDFGVVVPSETGGLSVDRGNGEKLYIIYGADQPDLIGVNNGMFNFIDNFNGGNTGTNGNIAPAPIIIMDASNNPQYKLYLETVAGAQGSFNITLS